MARRKVITSKPAKPETLPIRRRKTVSGVFQTQISSELAMTVDDEWTRLSEQAEETWFVRAG